MLAIDHVHVDPNEIAETGEYDLEGLFVRLKYAIESVGAKRVVLDTIEALFSGFSNTAILRAEIRRLFQFLKSFGVTAIVTGERGENSLTRYGLEEYVADCVILLDQRVTDQVTTRRLRVVKYRGSGHGTNEYPFIIDERGFSLLPVSSMGLRHKVSSEVISTGVPDLDAMLGVGGYFRGTSVLISGTAGMGKTSFASALVRSICERGERALYFAFEESPDQIVRNMQSIGIDLRPHLDSGLLRIVAQRPFLYNLEMHLVTIQKEVTQFRPSVVVVDPVSNLIAAGSVREANAMLTLLIDFLKTEGITAFFTVLTENGGRTEATDVGISSLIDTWMLARDIEVSGERNRGLYVLKSRGMNHSNQIREFTLSDARDQADRGLPRAGGHAHGFGASCDRRAGTRRVNPAGRRARAQTRAARAQTQGHGSADRSAARRIRGRRGRNREDCRARQQTRRAAGQQSDGDGKEPQSKSSLASNPRAEIMRDEIGR